MATRTGNGTRYGLIIICILIAAMLLRCTEPEMQAQMSKDISGLTQEQKGRVISWQQQSLFPGGLSK